MSDKIITEHFRYCPRCGAKTLERHEGKSNAIFCRSCSFTLYFNPNCSSAALVFDQAGRLLVIERAREPARGKFGVPGGFADFGERLEQVALREAKEEVNLDLSSLEFLASFPNVYPYRGVLYPVTDSYFVGKVSSFEGMRPEEAEVAGIRFVEPADVPDEQWAFPSLRNAIHLYLERFRG